MISLPLCQVDDYVLCRVLHEKIGIECYVPGKVTALPVNGDNEIIFYTVAQYNNRQVGGSLKAKTHMIVFLFSEKSV